MHRRQFLSSLVSASALSLSRAAWGQGAAEAGAPIRIGFLGASHSHAMAKIRVVQESSEFSLTGACEDQPAVRERLRAAQVSLLTKEELWRASTVVVVESGVKHHARDAKAALLAGKHVHVEKPPADSLKGFLELQELARERKLLLQVGYMWRFNPGINLAIEAARQGWLGEVFQVRGTMNTLISPEERAVWAQFPGGALFEQGCHLIDPLIRLLGKPVKVSSVLGQHSPSGDGLADNTIAIFEFPRALGLVTNAALQPGAGPHRSFEIFGTNGVASVKPLEQPVLTLDMVKPAGPYAAGPQPVTLPPYRRYVAEFAELARCLRTGQVLSVSPEEELRVQEALLEASRM